MYKNIEIKSANVVLFLFLLFMSYGYFASYREGLGLFSFNGGGEYEPYYRYYQNPVIKFVNNGAWLIDILLMMALVVMSLPKIASQVMCKHLPKVFSVLLLIGIILPWFELYYGSTFYYGEVRGEQGLPILVCNFGLIGSFVFSFCFLKINLRKDFYTQHLKPIILALVSAHAGFGYLLGKYWNW